MVGDIDMIQLWAGSLFIMSDQGARGGMAVCISDREQ
jgi:hypothetical protein